MLLVFDVDGVLVSTSFRAIMKGYEAVITGILKKDLKNFTFMKSKESFKKWWNANWKENERRLGVKKKNREEVHRLFYETVRPYLYLLPWWYLELHRLSKEHRLVILTNRHRKNAMNQLEPVAHHFEIIFGAEDVLRLKPDPGGLKTLLLKTGTWRKDALIIGDMPVDMETGRAAGVKTGAVIWEHGLGTEEDFSKLSFEPDYIFRTPQCFSRLLTPQLRG